MRSASQLTTRMLGMPAAAQAARLLTTGRLRILAYHAVPDPFAFRAQMDHLVRFYSPVSGSTVIADVEGHESLPQHAVWVTFDDGHPDVLDTAEPVLAELRIPATLFIVAGLVDTEDPFWWTVIDLAQVCGLADAGCLARLKKCPDADRRAEVARLARELAQCQGRAPATRQLTSDQLRRWVAAGHEIGNQSWDHPCLDRSPPREQLTQVRKAHTWLTELLGCEPRLFAYPNGNWTPTVDRELRVLNYAVALLFDHHLAATSKDPFRMSRLRIDSAASLPRFRAVISGGHSGLFAVHKAARRQVRLTPTVKASSSSGVRP